MVNKCFCDRCSKEVESDRNELHFTGVRRTRWGYDKSLNLCNDCLKEFEEWLIHKGGNINLKPKR